MTVQYSSNIIAYNNRRMMLKISNKLQLRNTTTNPFQANQHKIYEQQQISRLFEPPYRQVFQLSYLYSSPLCTYYPPFLEIIKMLENFNADTLAIQQSKPRNQDHLKVLCMRFIYREMLTIAVMEKNQILKNDYATKLKNWYYQLSEKHSFLEGINFKKKKTHEDRLEDMIRKSYVSNVFDEIDDYLRKRLSYEDSPFQRAFQKQNLLGQKRKTSEQSQMVNLPLIDIQLYKRQEQLLRRYREQQVENKYFRDIKVNKNKMREASLNSLKNRQLKNNIILTQPKSTIKLATSFHGPLNDLKNERANKSSKSLIGRLDMSEHLDWRRKPSQIANMVEEKKKDRLTLININGINLIHSKQE